MTAEERVRIETEEKERAIFLSTLKMNRHFQEGVLKVWSEAKYRFYGLEIRTAVEPERMYRAQGALDVLDAFMEIFTKADKRVRGKK